LGEESLWCMRPGMLRDELGIKTHNTMRCHRCKKPLSRPSLSILTRRGYQHFGPKCARLAGLIQPKRKSVRIRHAQPETDPRQMALSL
jgi:hypothetical protein